LRPFPPLPPEQAEFIRRRTKPILDQKPEFAQLRSRLLELGGNEVIFRGSEFDINDVFERGRTFPTAGLRRRFIDDWECHSNAGLIWLESEGRTGIATGYAIEEDGLWIPHSWGFEDGLVIETTSTRWFGYFGYELGRSEAWKFTLAQLTKEQVCNAWTESMFSELEAWMQTPGFPNSEPPVAAQERQRYRPTITEVSEGR
jgi:hypothetical protein